MTLGSGDEYRVFLSYGHADGWMIDQLKKDIEALGGVRVFLDVDELEFGDTFCHEIVTEIQNADELLVMLSPTSISRAWIYAEIGAALVMNKRVVGLMHGIELKELRENGALSLFGEKHHIFKPRDEIALYLGQLKKRIEEKGGAR